METNYIIFYQILAILTLNCYCEVLRQLRGLKSLNGDLASGSDDLSLKIWKRTNENFEMDRPTGGILSQVILKNGNLAEGMQEDKKEIIYISDTVTNEKIISLKGHSGSIWCLAVLKNGDLASGSQDKTIKIWDTNSGELKNTLRGHIGPVTSLAVLNNGFLASGSADTTIKFWNPIEKKENFTLSDHSGRILCLAVLQNGYLAAGYNDSLIIIWNPNYIKFNNSKLNKHLSKTLSGHSNKVYSLALLKDGDLASGSGDKTIKIWNTNNFKLIKTLTGHSDKILCLAVLKNGDLASGSQDKTIKIWNTNSGNVRTTISNDMYRFISLAVFDNGDLIGGYSALKFEIFKTSFVSKRIEEDEKILFKGSERTQEGDKCDFTGPRTNQDDCKGYFYCKNNKVSKKQCTDKKLFDEKSKTCKELKDVFCGNRSLSNEENLCSSRPDGYYPNIENDCVDFFKCENLKTANRSKCSNGLKFNNITLKCDHTSNITEPCGTKFVSNHYLHKTEFNFSIFFGLITSLYFFISFVLITSLTVLSCRNWI